MFQPPEIRKRLKAVFTKDLSFDRHRAL